MNAVFEIGMPDLAGGDDFVTKKTKESEFLPIGGTSKTRNA